MRYYVMKCGLLLIGCLWFLGISAQPLPAEQAFAFSAKLVNNNLILNFTVAPGYHLYRDKLAITSPTLNIKITDLPVGRQWHDPHFGNVIILDNSAIVNARLTNSTPQETHIYVHYQGCSDQGFCYPPITQDLLVQLSVVGQQIVDINAIENGSADSMPVLALSNVDKMNHLLFQRSDWVTLLVLFGLGVLLAFTPCVLPMIPILSGIVLGQRDLTTSKAFFLALSYVTTMALTYAILGIIMGAVGVNVQASLQQPWIVFIFSGLFVVLSLAMFDCYELQLPTFITKHLIKVTNQQHEGSFFGAAVMGLLSALIVSPCVSAPLIGVLAYITTTGNAWFGGIGLFILAFGMGLPLIIAATFGRHLLPQSGTWMIRIKHIGGFLLLWVAIYFAARALSASTVLILYGLLAFSVAVYLWRIKHSFRIVGFVVGLYATVTIIGGIIGHQDPLQPWRKPMVNDLSFITINSLEEVQQQVIHANGRYVLLDFYADWCLACKEMDLNVFSNNDIKNRLQSMLLLRVDITANNTADKILLSYFKVYGPPTLVLLIPDDYQLVTAKRWVGGVSSDQLLAWLPPSATLIRQ